MYRMRQVASFLLTRRSLPASPCRNEINAGQPHCLARRGYRRRLSAPVVGGTGVDLVQACQGSCAPAWAVGAVRLVGQRYLHKCSTRAHFSPKNRNRRFSARHSAVKTDKNGVFRYSKKSRAVFVACERSEVLTARKCRALQSHAVFWEMRHKNVKHRLNNLSRRYT